jgi:hypothetical protein
MRNLPTDEFYRTHDRGCKYCGLLLSGPHKDEHMPPESIRTDVYKGRPITGAICPTCAERQHQEALAYYKFRHGNGP